MAIRIVTVALGLFLGTAIYFAWYSWPTRPAEPTPQQQLQGCEDRLANIERVAAEAAQRSENKLQACETARRACPCAPEMVP